MRDRAATDATKGHACYARSTVATPFQQCSQRLQAWQRHGTTWASPHRTQRAPPDRPRSRRLNPWQWPSQPHRFWRGARRSQWAHLAAHTQMKNGKLRKGHGSTLPPMSLLLASQTPTNGSTPIWLSGHHRTGCVAAYLSTACVINVYDTNQVRVLQGVRASFLSTQLHVSGSQGTVQVHCLVRNSPPSPRGLPWP